MRETLGSLLAVTCVVAGLSACDNTSGSPGQDDAAASASVVIDRPSLAGIKAVCGQSLESAAKSMKKKIKVTWTWPSGSASDNVRCYTDNDSAVKGEDGAKAVMWVEVVPDLLAGKNIPAGYSQADDCSFLDSLHNRPKTRTARIAGQPVCTGSTTRKPGEGPGYERSSVYRSRGMIITVGAAGYLESKGKAKTLPKPAVSLVDELQSTLITKVVKDLAKAE